MTHAQLPPDRRIPSPAIRWRRRFTAAGNGSSSAPSATETAQPRDPQDPAGRVPLARRDRRAAPGIRAPPRARHPRRGGGPGAGDPPRPGGPGAGGRGRRLAQVAARPRAARARPVLRRRARRSPPPSAGFTSSGIIHKDINPNNVLVNLTTGDVRLIDFSISSRLAAEHQRHLQHPHLLEGTIAYMSPEQTGRMNRGRRPPLGPLLVRRHLLRDAHRHAALRVARSAGGDSRARRPGTGGAARPRTRSAAAPLRRRHAAHGQERRGPVSERRGRRGRPPPLPRRMAAHRPGRALPAGAGRRARAVRAAAAAVRPRARGGAADGRVRARGRRAARSWCWSRAIRGSARPR